MSEALLEEFEVNDTLPYFSLCLTLSTGSGIHLSDGASQSVSLCRHPASLMLKLL
jgi:hypothetical protein